MLEPVALNYVVPFLIPPPNINKKSCMSDWLLIQSVLMRDWQTNWRSCFFGGLAEGPEDRLPGWRRARKQSFPTCSSPRRISAGERCPRPFALFTVRSPAVGVQPRFISTSAWNASPTAAINQQQRLSLPLSLASPFSSLLYAHRHAGWGHSERVNRCRLIRPGLPDIARVMYLMWSLFSSNKRIKN